MDLNPDAIRTRFHQLTAEGGAIEAVLAPLRAELGDLVAGETDLSVKAANAREAELRSQIKAQQALLFPIEQERAICSRALGGKTGPAPEA